MHVYIQWNASITDTIWATGSLLFGEVPSFQAVFVKFSMYIRSWDPLNGGFLNLRVVLIKRFHCRDMWLPNELSTLAMSEMHGVVQHYQ